MGETRGYTNELIVTKRDVAALCFSVGRVTPAMLQIQAEDYWRIERRKETNSAYAPAIEDYQGTAVYLMGMSYFERAGEFQRLNQNLHKVQMVSRFAEGLSKLTTTEVGGTTKVQPGVDMLHNETAIAGNRTVHPDSGEDPTAAQVVSLARPGQQFGRRTRDAQPILWGNQFDLHGEIAPIGATARWSEPAKGSSNWTRTITWREEIKRQPIMVAPC